MGNNNQKISACLVVYNEEKIIERCLLSIKNLVDEIIVVHDGECADKTLEIVKNYTDKIFVREHVGIAEPHRTFALLQAAGNWILQIDGDEYLDAADHIRIREMIENCSSEIDGYIFKWEMWNGKHPVYFKGLQKMCLFRKKNFFFRGIPQEPGQVKGSVKKTDIFLHHQPLYNNISWEHFLRKTKKWTPIHARYFFPELVKYECYNTTSDKWIDYANQVTKHPLFHMAVYPLKTSLAQLKNGLWTSWIGLNLVCQTYAYYFCLHWQIWKMKKKPELS